MFLGLLSNVGIVVYWSLLGPLIKLKTGCGDDSLATSKAPKANVHFGAPIAVFTFGKKPPYACGIELK